MYQSARTTPRGRAFLVTEAARIGVSQAARNMGVSRRTVYRWKRRAPNFADRPCRPHHSPRRSSDPIEANVLVLRLERRWGPDRIGPQLGLRPSTVHRILRRHHAHRLSHLFPIPPRSFGHFERLRPGELMALDIKSLGSLARGGGRRAVMHRDGRRGVGWRHLHVAMDLASRMVFTELRAGLGGADAVAFLEHALAAFDARGIRVERLLSDNGAGYKSNRFRDACQALGLRHTRTKPRHPWTNGRVERFIGTVQQECLYAQPFTSDPERDLAIALYVAYYNAERTHTALEGLAPLDWLRREGVTYVRGDLN